MNINVTVDNVDLTSIVGETYTQTGEDSYGSAPVTLADAIAAEVARNLRDDERWPALRERFLKIRDEEIREQIRPVVAEAVNSPVQRTNGYGSPVGEPFSLTELILKEARDYLSKRDGYDRDRPTVAEKLIREAVDRTVKTELAQAISDEKATVVAAVRAKAADLIAQSVKEGVGR